MFTRIILAFGTAMLLMLLLFGGFSLYRDEAIVYAEDDLLVTVTKPVFLTLSEPEETERTIETTDEVTFSQRIRFFGIDVGTYELTKRTLGNGSRFLFEQAENTGLLPFALETTVTGLEDAEWKTWNPEIVTHDADPEYGMDRTANPFGTIAHTNGEALQGNIYISKEQVTEYEDGTESRIRELRSEIRQLDMEAGAVVRRFWVPPQHMAETWILLSYEPLFETEELEDEWIDYALHHPNEQLNWLTADGPYTKLPVSIEPATSGGYGRAIERLADDSAVEWMAQSSSPFFESMMLNSRVNLLNYMAEAGGGTRWPTEYTNLSLKDEYGITAPYVDTRVNSHAALYLDTTAELYADRIPQEGSVASKYADYLLGLIQSGKTIEAGNGLLIADYASEHANSTLTHASLNHSLDDLKIFMRAYNSSKEEKYMAAAEQIMTGIEQLGQNEGGWIRDDGDLWYGVRPDGTFIGDDDPESTLISLLETQTMAEEMSLERNPYFDDMIDAKLSFLASHGIEITESVTKLLK